MLALRLSSLRSNGMGGWAVDHAILLDWYQGHEGPGNWAVSFQGTHDQCHARTTHDGTTFPIPKAQYDAVIVEATSLTDGNGVPAPGGIYRLDPVAEVRAVRKPRKPRTARPAAKGKPAVGTSRKRTVALLSLLLAGCTLIQPKPVIENRFSVTTQVTPTDDAAAAVQLAVTSAPVARDGGKDDSVKITQLSDRGQAALITATQGKPPATLSDNKKDGGASDVTLANTISRRIVVAVRPSQFLDPGDRVDAIRVEMKVADPQRPDWRISSWTQASNGQTVIDIGKLTDTANSKVSASTGLDIAKFLPDATVAAEASRSLAREVQLKDTTDFDAAVDSEGRAWLDETAGWRVSLAHNLGIDVTLTAPSQQLYPVNYFTASKLMGDPPKDGLAPPLAAKQIQLRQVTRYVHQRDAAPVCGYATLTYRIRHIGNAKGRATFSESDDLVIYRKGSSSVGFLLAPAPFDPLYALETNGLRLTYVDLAKHRAGLQFASLGDATAFRNWLTRALPKGGKIGNGEIGIWTGAKLRTLTADEQAALMPVVADQGRLDTARAADTETCPAPLTQAPVGVTPKASGATP